MQFLPCYYFLYAALQSLSSINFFPLVLLSTVEIGSLSNDKNGKKQ